jgi:hypothetical protein
MARLALIARIAQRRRHGVVAPDVSGALALFIASPPRMSTGAGHDVGDWRCVRIAPAATSRKTLSSA